MVVWGRRKNGQRYRKDGKPMKFTGNFDGETGKLKIKDITDTDGGMFLITSTQKGNRVIQTGGNAQLEYIKKLQSNDGNKFNIHTGKLNRTIIP